MKILSQKVCFLFVFTFEELLVKTLVEILVETFSDPLVKFLVETQY